MGEVELLLETLQTEGAHRRYSTRWIRVAVIGIFALSLFECIVGIVKGRSIDFADVLIYGSLLGGSCAYGLTPGLRKAVTEASAISDKRFLGAMIEALDSGDAQLKTALEQATTGLLEQVTGDDLGLLDDYQLDQLARAVRVSTDARFYKAAVRALGSIGTNRTLHNLEIFLNDPFIPKVRRSRLEPHIRAAMGELRIRLAKEVFTNGDLDLDTSLSAQLTHAAKSVAGIGKELMSGFDQPSEGPEVVSQKKVG
jgi:hypothetical protein